MPSEVQSIIERAQTLVRVGRHAEGAASFAAAAALRPDVAALHHNLGSVLEALGRPEEAASSFSRALRRDPELGEARRALAGLAARSSDRAAAAVAEGDLAGAAALYRAACKVAPSDATLQLRLAEVLAQRHAAAAAAIEASLAGAAVVEAAEALGTEAAEARHAYHRAIALSPGLGDAYVGLGGLAMRLNAWGEASKWLTHGTALLPDSGQAWLWLGIASREAAAEEGGSTAGVGAGVGGGGASLAGSLAALERATRLGPTQPDAYWQLGEARAAAGQRRAALRSLGHAVRISPDHLEAYSTLARVVSDEVASSQAARLAEAAFREALRIDPAHHETLHNLAMYHTTGGRPRRAILAFQRAVAAAPSSGDSWLGLGEALQRSCRMGEARGAYARAAELLPRSARAQVHRLLMSDEAVAGGGGDGGGDGDGDGDDTGGSEGRRPPLPTLAELRIDVTTDGWEPRAASVLAWHGVVVVRGLVGRELAGRLLQQVEGWRRRR